MTKAGALMELRESSAGQIELRLSPEQLKRLYVALFCKLQTGGCTAFDELEDDLLLQMQSYLQRYAAAQGVDCTAHEQWERFLGITHPQHCPRGILPADTTETTSAT